MSVLNLGLQCVALARAEMSEEFEVEVAKYNSIGELRKIAERKEGIVEAVIKIAYPVLKFYFVMSFHV